MKWNKLSTVILIDASYIAYKLYHGHVKSDDLDANIAEKMASVALNIQNGCPKSIVVVCYDRPPTHRKRIYPKYKANRPKNECTEAVKNHIKNSGYWMSQKGIKFDWFEGHEADDVIASYCAKLVKAGINVKILSSDKDMYPLLQYKNVEIFRSFSAFRNNSGNYFLELTEGVDAQSVYKRFLVHPRQWTDFRCLSGDVSDNISGMQGWGEAKSAKFLRIYESIKNAIKQWDIVSVGLTKTTRESLKTFLDSDYQTMLRLFILEDSLPVTFRDKKTSQEFSKVFQKPSQ